MRPWLVVLCLFLLPAVAAQPGCGDYCDYDYGDYNEEDMCVHAVEYSDGGDEIVYEYAYVCNGDVEAVEWLFETGGAPMFWLEAAKVSGNGASVAAMELGLEFTALVEFEDADGDHAYNPEVDETLNVDQFEGRHWSNIDAKPQGRGVAFTADYDMSFGGTFRIAAVASAESYRAGPSRVQPTDTKIDFEFHDMVYQSATSQVAIVMTLTSEVASVSGGSTRGIQSGEQGFAIGGGESAYFAWAKTAMVDGKSRPVFSYDEIATETASQSGGGASVEASEAYGALSLAYVQGSDIVHDPRLGVAFSQGGKNAPVPTWMVIPALAVAALARRR